MCRVGRWLPSKQPSCQVDTASALKQRCSAASASGCPLLATAPPPPQLLLNRQRCFANGAWRGHVGKVAPPPLHRPFQPRRRRRTIGCGACGQAQAIAGADSGSAAAAGSATLQEQPGVEAEVAGSGCTRGAAGAAVLLLLPTQRANGRSSSCSIRSDSPASCCHRQTLLLGKRQRRRDGRLQAWRQRQCRRLCGQLAAVLVGGDVSQLAACRGEQGWRLRGCWRMDVSTCASHAACTLRKLPPLQAHLPGASMRPSRPPTALAAGAAAAAAAAPPPPPPLLPQWPRRGR